MRRRRGLLPVQWVRVVSWGPEESLHQHAHQDKAGTPGLEHSGRGTANPPYSFHPLTPPHPPSPWPIPALTGPQPPTPLFPTSPKCHLQFQRETYLSISRGLLTSPALQNSKGNVVPNNGKKCISNKSFWLCSITPKELTVMKNNNNKWTWQQLTWTTLAPWPLDFFPSSSCEKGVLTLLEGHNCSLLESQPIQSQHSAVYRPVLCLYEAHVLSDWGQVWPTVGQGNFGRRDSWMTGRGQEEDIIQSRSPPNGPHPCDPVTLQPHPIYPHRPRYRRQGLAEQQHHLPYWLFITVFSLLFLKYDLLAPFAVLIMTWCKQLLLIGLFLMSPFSFLQYEGCMNVVFIRLWELVRERFLAVAAETQMSAGYVAKAIWLAMHSEPEKVPLFKWGWKLDVSTLFIVKCVAHIKKCSGILCLLALKHILGLWSDSLTWAKETSFSLFCRSLRKFLNLELGLKLRKL